MFAARMRDPVMEDGACFAALSAEIDAMVREAAEAGLEDDAGSVTRAWHAVGEARSASVHRMGALGAAAAPANATLFLYGFGHIVVTALWLRQAAVACRALPSASQGDVAFYRGKVQAMRYMVHHELHLARSWLQTTLTGDSTVLETEADWL
jgi:hypothetical protein